MRYHRVSSIAAAVCMAVACMCGCTRGGKEPDSGELLVTAAETENSEAFEWEGGLEPEQTERLADGEEDAEGESSSLYGDDGKEAVTGGNIPGTADSAGLAETLEPSDTDGYVCWVHICGEVISPGVYELEAGSRIYQAVEAAGGFTEHAAAEYLNMAEAVCDGMKIVVPDLRTLSEEQARGPAVDGEAAVGIVAGGNAENGGSAAGNLSGRNGSGGDRSGGNSAGQPAKGTGKVNINTAAKEELMTLKGIGEARAEDIIAYRESHGGFSRIEDIMKISGIKNAAFDKIKDDITV